MPPIPRSVRIRSNYFPRDYIEADPKLMLWKLTQMLREGFTLYKLPVGSFSCIFTCRLISPKKHNDNSSARQLLRQTHMEILVRAYLNQHAPAAALRNPMSGCSSRGSTKRRKASHTSKIPVKRCSSALLIGVIRSKRQFSVPLYVRGRTRRIKN